MARNGQLVLGTFLSGAISLCAAQTTVIIDFESLAIPTATQRSIGRVYSEDGFVVRGDSLYGLEYVGTAHPWFTGSTALYNGSLDGITRVLRTNGAPFDLLAITLSPLHLRFDQDVRFFAYHGCELKAIQVFRLPGNALRQKFRFYNFTNITEVYWQATDHGQQFDDITVRFTTRRLPQIPYQRSPVFPFQPVVKRRTAASWFLHSR